MGRIYRTLFNEVAVTAIQDLFEITAASGKHVIIHEWGLFQRSEVGDAAEEALNVLVRRCSSGSTSGSGGSTHTPVAQNLSDAAAGAAVEINNTTRVTGGTVTTEEVHQWNIRSPYRQVYTPETRPQIAPGERKTWELPVAPADSVTMSGYVVFEELG